jgi:hypothetical protein
MKFDWLAKLPTAILLLIIGVICVILGAATQIPIGSSSLRIAERYSLPVIILGAFIVVTALFAVVVDLRRPKVEVGSKLPVARVIVDSIEKIADAKGSGTLRVLVSGRVEPATQGVRVWLLREHVARTPGRFSVDANPAVTDKNGRWEQIAYLWGEGKFRVHGVIGPPLADQLFSYYRTAFDHARAVYKEKVDPQASSLPGWPNLLEVPSDCISEYREITV